MPLLLCIIIGMVSALMPSLSLKPLMPVAGGLYLLLSGLELNLRHVRGELGLIAKLWLGSFVIPFLAGLVLVYAWPNLFEHPAGVDASKTALILAVALAVSAVPVILKIMQELGWVGTIRAQRVVLTAVLCDLTAWIVFFPLLPMQDQSHWLSSHLPLLMFFVGLVGAYFIADFTKTKKYLAYFNKWIVASLFFIGVGQSLYLTHSFNIIQAVIVFIVACLAKLIGAGVMARWAGLTRSESFTLGMALNARGAMEILLASFAFREGLISGDLFTTLVIMAMGTSLVIKPVLRIAKIS